MFFIGELDGRCRERGYKGAKVAHDRFYQIKRKMLEGGAASAPIVTPTKVKARGSAKKSASEDKGSKSPLPMINKTNGSGKKRVKVEAGIKYGRDSDSESASDFGRDQGLLLGLNSAIHTSWDGRMFCFVCVNLWHSYVIHLTV